SHKHGENCVLATLERSGNPVKGWNVLSAEFLNGTPECFPGWTDAHYQSGVVSIFVSSLHSDACFQSSRFHRRGGFQFIDHHLTSSGRNVNQIPLGCACRYLCEHGG